ncbi:class I SAM-dependent methyltransferase [bacterium]|nr:class I SAM-dependent methyltransferase [bacterium]
MSGYYSIKLSGKRLKRCYDLATPRIKRYLSEEINHVLDQISSNCSILELGCGYGRILSKLSPHVDFAVGIDTSLDSLMFSRGYLKSCLNTAVICMDALNLGLLPGQSDVVCCLQNGISSFHADKRLLIESAVRAVKPGGKVLLSSYAPEFWEHRLEWFRLQSANGLLGKIDDDATGNGTIVCQDGFSATTVSADQFSVLTSGLGRDVSVYSVDYSSVFCRITV